MVLLLACVLFGAFPQEPENGVCAHYKMPVHGTIIPNRLLGGLVGFFGDRPLEAFWAASVIPIFPDTPRNTLTRASGGECIAHCRHHVASAKIWYSCGPERLYCAGFRDMNETSRPLPTLLARYEQLAPGKFNRPFSRNEPAKGVAIDFAPLAEEAVRVFFFDMKTKKIESWEFEWALVRSKDERGAERWDRKAIAEERNPETIDSAFTEDFYVFKRDAGYFFVTQSGKLYLAPPPKQGEKSRTMKALWEDPKRPIVAVLEHAERAKIWLFANDKNPGAEGDLFFEMKEEIHAEAFDPSKLKPVELKVPGRAKMLLEYLPLVRKE